MSIFKLIIPYFASALLLGTSGCLKMNNDSPVEEEGTTSSSTTTTTSSGTSTSGSSTGSTSSASSASTTTGTAPTLSLSAPSSSTITHAGTVTYTLTITDATSNSLTAAGVTLNTTGTATCSKAVSGVSATGATITLSSCTGTGTVGISIAAGIATSSTSVTSAASSASTTFTLTATAGPSISISAPTLSNGSDRIKSTHTAAFTITFTDAAAVTLASGNVSLTTTGGATCTATASGTGTATRTVTLSACSGDGTVAISLAANVSTDTYGDPNSATSASTAVTIDNSAPANPTSISVNASPANGYYSAKSNPVVSGNSSENGSTIIVYSGTACDTQVDSVTVSGGTFATTAITVTGTGTKSFSYKTQDSIGNISSCVNPSIGYAFKATPEIQFSRVFFSATEGGTAIGSAVTISRDTIDTTSSVSFTTLGVTAISGTDYTDYTTTVNFGTSDTSQTIAIGSFSIVSNGTDEGDRYFAMKLSSPSTATLGTRKFAHFNIIDDDRTGEYFFGTPLFSANENDGTMTLTIQRLTTNTTASVQVSFVDGSATGGGTDYDSATQTVNFVSGDAEKTITVTLVNNATQADSHNFYAKLVSPSTGTTVRSSSIAKVRILDDDDTATCDATNTNTSTNLGFGGLSGGVYYICSAAQLWKTRSNLGLSYKLMADIDVDATDTSIDADTGTVGTQAFSPPSTAAFTGSFDGNEKIIYNMRLLTANANVGLFTSSTAASDAGKTLQNLNILYYSLESTNAASTPAPLVNILAGSAAVYTPVVKHIFTSGFIKAPVKVGGIISLLYPATSTSGASTSITYLLSHGKAIATSGGTNNMGGIIGMTTVAAVSPAITLNHLYNTSDVTSNYTYSGGVMGQFDATTSANPAGGSLTLNDIENRGRITAAQSNAGGIIGFFTTLTSVTATGLRNYGKLVGSSQNTCGIIGTLKLKGTNTTNSFSDIRNYGDITAGTGYAAGHIGSVTIDTNSGITFNYGLTGAANENTNTGTISGTTYIGGLIGSITTATNPNSATITLDNLSNSGSVAGAGNYVGGLIGQIPLSGTSTNLAFTLKNSTNSGAVSHSGGAHNQFGGLVGSINFNPSGTGGSVVLTSLTNSGTVTSVPGFTCGGIIGGFNASGTTATFTYTNLRNTSTGTVSCTDRAGGIVGAYNIGTGTTHTMVTNDGVTTNAAAVTGTAGSANSSTPFFWTSAGGIFGTTYVAANASSSSFTLTNLTNSGTITGAHKNVAGGIGNHSIYAGTGASNTFTITGFVNSGNILNSVIGKENMGGVIGKYAVYATGTGNNLTVSSSRNTGDIGNATYPGNYLGGLVGYIEHNTASSGAGTYAISGVSGTTTNTGAINCTGYLACGGVIGSASFAVGAHTIGFTDLSNSGTVAVNTYGGGIIGNLSLAGGGTATATRLTNLAAGSVTCTSHWCGGIHGQIQATHATSVYNGSYLNNAATITGSAQYTSGIVAVHNGVVGSSTTISKSTNTGTIAASLYGSGIMTTNGGNGYGLTLTDVNNQGTMSGSSAAGILYVVLAFNAAGPTITRGILSGSNGATTKTSIANTTTNVAFTNCYFRKDAGGTNSSITTSGGTELSTANFTNSGNFTGFTFSGTTGEWNTTSNTVYPFINQ